VNIYSDMLELVGRTPMVRINKINDGACRIYAKLEFYNPSSSVKDRPALYMIEEGIRAGRITEKTTIIEPTSGNTGIGLAFVCAVKGLHLIIVMPESMSIERRKIIQSFGAELILTPAAEGMSGAVAKAELLRHEISDAVIAGQFVNPANPESHRKTTAREIWDDTEGTVDILVAGVGTGGTISGTGASLKKKKNSVQLVAVESAKSTLLSGGTHEAHKIQGIGANFIPEVCDRSIIDRYMQITEEQARSTAQRLAREEGIFAGYSSGAAMAAALQLSGEQSDRCIVVILPSGGDRYLSTDLYDQEGM